MGLGSWPSVSLAEARKARNRWRDVLSSGRDPIDVRKQDNADQTAERDRLDPTFEDWTLRVFEARKATLRGQGRRGRWLSPFETHLFPQMGQRRLSELNPDILHDAFKPIWHTKWPTAEKAYQRTKIVLQEGQFMDLPCDPLDMEKAKRMLGAVNHVTTPTPSTPWQEIPDLYQRLPDTTGGDCLRLMILTLVRLDGCAGAHESEFDEGLWTVPAERIKGRVGKVTDFRVPLSTPAQALIKARSEFFNGLLFPGHTGRAIGSRGLEVILDRMEEPGRPHGFRSSFRTWTQDVDACSWEVAETVLGHTVGNKVERAYARSDLLERRRIVLEQWADHVTGAKGNVVNITR